MRRSQQIQRWNSKSSLELQAKEFSIGHTILRSASASLYYRDGQIQLLILSPSAAGF